MDFKELLRVHRKKTYLEIAKLLYELYTYTNNQNHKDLADKYLRWSKLLQK